MLVLGIETSCDDTGAAVVRDGKEILSNCVTSQDSFHKRFSGVVPEIASRKHLEVIHYVVQQALEEAGLVPEDIDRIAVTNRPGLVGSLLVGVSAAKGYSWAWDKPLVPVNHIAAHLYAPAFENDFAYPAVGLAISGGHTLLVIIRGPLEVEIVGSTIDDAVGEVFDKIAKYFDLGYPGGPIIDRLAADGDPEAYSFPRTLLDPVNQRYDFSFSGLKTAVIHQRNRFRKNPDIEGRLEDVAASYQRAVCDILLAKTGRLCEDTGIRTVLVSGGVAANSAIRTAFSEADEFTAIFPSRPLCMDNAAMVAGAGAFGEVIGDRSARNSLEVTSRIVLRGRRRKPDDPESPLYRCN